VTVEALIRAANLRNAAGLVLDHVEAEAVVEGVRHARVLAEIHVKPLVPAIIRKLAA
jgi:hypothetical protein